MQTALRKKTETGNEKDPSAALGMTKRGNASFHSFSTCCGSQPRLAALGEPLPREGARVDTPSFLWKEVPRRGGGWMGKAVSPKQSLPRVGKVASGASRIGY